MPRSALASIVTLGVALGTACGGGKKGPPPDPTPLIDAVVDLAESACKCETDKECLHGVRDEWDGQKEHLLEDGPRLEGDNKVVFDRELAKMRACGDAGGLTFWDH